MPDTQVFKDVDAAKWQRIKDAIKAKSGIEITTDAGIASAKGIKLGWSWLEADKSLAVTQIERSFFDPSEGKIDADIAQWITTA